MWHINIINYAALWIVLFCNLHASDIASYRQSTTLEPIVLPGSSDVQYEREVNVSVEYIFEFSNLTVSKVFLGFYRIFGLIIIFKSAFNLKSFKIIKRSYSFMQT